MQTISYPIKLYGDASALEKTIKGVEGRLDRLSSDEFLVTLKYDGNIKGFNSQIDKIMALNPEIPIDFKYNLNKKALEAEEKKLQSFIDKQKLDILSISSGDNIKKQIQEIVSYIEKNTKKLEDGSLFFEDEKNINSISKKIRDLYSNIATAKEFFGTDWKPPKEFMEFISLITNKVYQLETIGTSSGVKPKKELLDTKEIENQKTKIEAVKSIIQSIEKDMSGNNVIENTMAASSQQIAELLNKLKEIKDELEIIGKKIPESISRPLDDVLDNGEINTWKNSFLSALREIKNEFQSIIGNNNKLGEIFNGYDLGDNIRSSKYPKITNPERSLGISRKTGYIHGEYSVGEVNSNNLSEAIVDDAFEKAREQIDVFLHSHAYNVAQFSMPHSKYDKNGNLLGTVGADLITSLTTDLKKGIEYQLLKAGNEIQLLNAKLLHDDFSEAFNDKNIEETKKAFAEAVDDFKAEFEDEFYKKFIFEYMKEYNHVINNPQMLTSLIKSAKVDTDGILENVKNADLENKFIAQFFEECKKDSYFGLEEILAATVEQFKGKISGAGELVDSSIIDKIVKRINELFEGHQLESLILNAIGLNKNDIYQQSLRANSGNIFKQVLGQDFDISKYVKTWKNYSDFLNENPLKLPTDKLSNIFDLNNAKEYLNLIKGIEEELNNISKKKIGNIFNSSKIEIPAFEESFKEKQISINESIQKIIDKLNDLDQNIKQLNNLEIKVGFDGSQKEISNILDGFVKLTNPDGTPLTAYRGQKNVFSGFKSNRYHEGTFSTPTRNLSKLYSGLGGKIYSGEIYGKNIEEIFGNNRNWDDILYVGNEENELSKAAKEAYGGFKRFRQNAEEYKEILQKLFLKIEDDGTFINKFTGECANSLEEALHVIQGGNFWDQLEKQIFPVENGKYLNTLTGEEFKDYESAIKDINTFRESFFLQLENLSNRDVEIIEKYAEWFRINADMNNPYGWGTTNHLTEKAFNSGIDTVIFRDIYDGLEETTDIFVTKYLEQFKNIISETLYPDVFNGELDQIYSNIFGTLQDAKNTYLKNINDGYDDNDLLSKIQEYTWQISSFLGDTLDYSLVSYLNGYISSMPTDDEIKSFVMNLSKSKSGEHYISARDIQDNIKDILAGHNDQNFIQRVLPEIEEYSDELSNAFTFFTEDSIHNFIDELRNIHGYSSKLDIDSKINIIRDYFPDILEEDAERIIHQLSLYSKGMTTPKEVTDGINIVLETYNDAIINSITNSILGSRFNKLALVDYGETDMREILGQSDNIDNTKLKEKKQDIEDITEAFITEGKIVDSSVDSEKESLRNLNTTIEEVIATIKTKTEEFELERQVVDNVVDSERDQLYLLITTLSEVQAVVEELSKNIAGIQDITFTGKIDIKGLNSLSDSIKEDKFKTKLDLITKYLKDFTKDINGISLQNDLMNQLNTILSKGDELKNLASILKKSNKGKIKNAGKAVTAKDSEDLRAYNDSYKTLISTEERYQELTNKQNAGLLLSAKEARELVKIEGNRTHAQEKINEIIKKTSGEIKKQSDAEQEFAEHQKTTAKAIEAAADAQAKLDAANNRKSLEKDLQKEIDALGKIELAPRFTQEFNGKITDEINKAKSALQGTDVEIEEMTGHLKEFRNSIPKNALESSYTALDAYALDISKTLTNNSKMSRKLKDELKTLYDTVIRYRKTGLFDDKDLLNVKNRIIEIKDEILHTEQNGRSMIDKIGMQIRHISSQQIARYFSFYDIIRYIRQISAEVIKVDTALTELRKVSDASNERLQQSLQKSTETAKDLGSTIDDVIKVTSDWARLGYNVDDAEELARVTTLFKNVGDNMSAEDASSFMISTLKGFEMEADQAIDIADKFNEVANNFAIDTMGIGDALQRSAASFNAANTDLNESIALITATNAVVQNPESVGTMWKTVSARIRGAKAELEEAGEDTEGMVESTSKLRDLVKGFTGFDIMEDEDTFKSIYDIILGIGEKWQDLNDIDRAALLEALAGKRAGNALAAALNNVDDLKAAYETALNASGSAMKEQENYEKSIQFSIDRLKATAQDLANDFLSSNTVKGAVDFLNTVLELLDKIVEKTGSLTPLIATISGVFGAAKLGKGMGGVADLLGELISSNKTDKKSILSGLSLDKIKTFLGKDVTEVFGGATKAAEEVGTSAASAAVEVDEMFDVMSAAQGAATYSEAMGTAAAAEGAVEAGAVGATMSVGALLSILAIAALVIGAGVIAFNHFNVTVEEVRKEVEETEGKVEDLKNEIKDLERIENKTTAQQNRLSLLKKELAVQEAQLETRKRLLLLEQTGTKSTDRFDIENINTRAAVETGNLVKDKSGWSNFWGHFFVGFKDSFYETAEDVLGNINSNTSEYHRIKDEFEAIDEEINSNSFRYYDESKKNQLLNSRERHLEMLQDAEDALSESVIKSEAKANELEAYLLEMEDAGISKESQAYKDIENIIKDLRSGSKVASKETGTYDVFADTDYINALSNHDEDTLKNLINSEKSHDEIVKILKSDYSDLIEVLEQNGYGVGHLIAKYQELTAAEKEAKEAAAMDPLSINESVDELSSLADQMGTIDTAFAELFNPDDMEVDLKNIKAIKDAFGEIEGFDLSSIEDELNDLYNATSPKEAQDAVDSLANSLLTESGILEKLDENNKTLITSELKRMGIENAEEVVNSALAISEKEVALEKEFNAVKSKDLVNATAEEIEEFIEETNRAGEAAQEVYLFALKKQFAAGININNPNEIQYLIDLARNAGVAAEACDKLAIAKARMQAVEAQYTAHKAQEERANRKNKDRKTGVSVEILTPDVIEYEQAAADATEYAKEIEEAISKTSVSPTKPIFGGGKAVDDAKKAAEKAGSAAKDAAEQFDWLETKIQRCEEEIQRLDKTVSATYKGWSKRNNAITSELDKVREKIALQASAYNIYMQKANAVGLSEQYKQLVMNGGLLIEEISDENLKKQINDFKTYYEKAIQAKDAIEDLNAQIAQLAKQKFDNVKSEFEGFTSEIDHFVSMIDKELSHVENMNKIAGKSFYNAKMGQDEQKLNDLYKERSALVDAMNEAVANGIEEGSADWIAMRNDIYSVDEAITDLTYEVEDLKKKLKEVAKLNFDDLKSQFENALSIITGQVDLTDAVVSMTQNAGYIASREYYKALIEGSKENVTGLRKEYETLSSTLADAMKAGDIEKYSEEWYQMSGDINNVKKELVDAANATIEYANALRQIDWDVFDRGLDRISKLVDESEFLQELMSWDDKLKDLDTGEWTAKGIAKQGLMVQDYQSYMSQANAYGGEAEEIRKLLETDPKNTVLIDRYHELLEAQRQAILNALKEKKALTDLIKEGYDELLKRIKKLIDEYKEALDQAKD